MTRSVFSGLIGAWLLACSYTSRIHMEEVEVTGGAAGEAPTPTSTTAGGASTGGAAAGAAGSASGDAGVQGARHSGGSGSERAK